MRHIGRTFNRNMAIRALVHIDAFLHAPVQYLLATWWLICGKRVRARARYAPLLANSPRAYAYWLLREGKTQTTDVSYQKPIIALVEITKNVSNIDATLNSLAAEGVEAHVIGADPRSDLQRIMDVVEWGAEPWFFLMIAGDELAIGAANIYRRSIQGCDVDVIYADEDFLDHRGRRTAPQFKSDWNSELFRHFDYLTGSCVVRGSREALAAAAACPDWASTLVTSTAGIKGALHIQQVLHHRRNRQSVPMPVRTIQFPPHMPRISVIVPTRNRMDLLTNCLASIRQCDFSTLEIIVVDNDSDDLATIGYLNSLKKDGVIVIQDRGPFNYSAINNRAVATATGDFICLLNNDVEAVSKDWISVMATQAMREDVGAVGAQLLYPDGRIQHAGVALGIGGAAGHAHRFVWPESEGYYWRHALPQFVSAVSAACLMVRRDRFLAVGGLNEIDFPVAFNDVDLCLRLNGRGWQSLYEPRAVLVHHESLSRGYDKDPIGAARFARELAALQRLWYTDQIVDPFHHPYLTRACEQFVLAV